MRIIIKFHEDCKADIRERLARLPGTIEDRRLLVGNDLDAMKRELVRATGHPAGAEYREGPPERYWWHFAAGCWIEYTITDSRVLFGTRTRTVEVMGFQPASPA